MFKNIVFFVSRRQLESQWNMMTFKNRSTIDQYRNH